MKKIIKNLAFILFVVFAFGSSAQTQLFNGKTLNGWESKPAERVVDWVVEAEQIVGANPHKKGSILWTAKNFKDFDLTLEYITETDHYDTGVFVRGESHQVQIGISGSLKKDMTGCIYAPKDDKGSYPAQTDKIDEFHKVGKWNKMRIIATGKRVQTFLNDEPFVDYIGVVIPEEGPIGLQLHPNVDMKVRFRNISVREL
ncbi:MAG: DUF1080 domain-containing protein [Prolixibacteraceae bacterium]|jgi:hypothetical protein|nr:DUF1080 domain-containing protein [Prolixibacteraceae bacterium]MBT6767183.1 DUF1080 domain-containing protein [Prolixibacteraceae bacterium]MBT6998731.1 DUF1080 domain-containing protein [Prolixibacteraceae bacterium]MBT7397547.1 DUF1080 domain-containing protein [Prolixibacteraceae bacterium]